MELSLKEDKSNICFISFFKNYITTCQNLRSQVFNILFELFIFLVNFLKISFIKSEWNDLQKIKFYNEIIINYEKQNSFYLQDLINIRDAFYDIKSYFYDYLIMNQIKLKKFTDKKLYQICYKIF